MLTNLLTKEDYLLTIRGKAKDVTNVGDAAVDIWPYVAEVTRGLDISRHVVEQQLIELVYRSEDENYDHVLIPYGVKNVNLVVVVDLMKKCVRGHYLLDLNEEYGLGY